MEVKESFLAMLRSHYLLRALLLDALDNMRAVWQRTLLSLLGIVIGTASVIALLSIGDNTADESERQFKAMGTDLIVVQNDIGGGSVGQTGKPLGVEDVTAIAREVSGIAVASPVALYPAKTGHSRRLLDTTAVGTDGGLLSAARFQLAAGRFIADQDAYDTVIVVGNGIAQALATEGIALKVGERVRIDNYLYTVVGILKESARNPLLPFDVNHALIMHYKASRRMAFYTGAIANIIIRTRGGYDPIVAVHEISAHLSARGKSALAQGAQQLIEGMQQQNRLFTWMLMGVGGISLLVAGIGVMNVMLASIAERRKEIGLRMAIGADRSSIMMMIVCESTVLSLTGGAIGTLLGLAVALLFCAFSGWTCSIPLFSIPLGLGMSLTTGLFFGIYPALKASQLSPIEALR